MRRNIPSYILPILTMLLYTNPLMAIPEDPPLDDDPIDAVPIDNGLMLLAFAAIIIGTYLVFKYQKSITLNSPLFYL